MLLLTLIGWMCLASTTWAGPSGWHTTQADVDLFHSRVFGVTARPTNGFITVHGSTATGHTLALNDEPHAPIHVPVVLANWIHDPRSEESRDALRALWNFGHPDDGDRYGVEWEVFWVEFEMTSGSGVSLFQTSFGGLLIEVTYPVYDQGGTRTHWASSSWFKPLWDGFRDGVIGLTPYHIISAALTNFVCDPAASVVDAFVIPPNVCEADCIAMVSDRRRKCIENANCEFFAASAQFIGELVACAAGCATSTLAFPPAWPSAWPSSTLPTAMRTSESWRV
jgi:hypothetical protein